MFCERGGFYIDPLKPVERAVITHAHSDHARPGHDHYLCSAVNVPLLRARLGSEISIESLNYGENKKIGEVEVSFFPAGHVLGSAQIRLEYKGEVWVVSGDYKRQNDPSCENFELVKCNTFITECSFGIPVYQWPAPEQEIEALMNWWQDNSKNGKTSVLFVYALGKAQRILSSLPEGAGPIGYHGSITRMLNAYKDHGIHFPLAAPITQDNRKKFQNKGLVLAPMSTQNSAWLKKFQPYSLAQASGWSLIRGNRRRQAVDQGFVISDHVDWPALLQTIKGTSADNIGLTHGQTDILKKWLIESGDYKVFTFSNHFAKYRDYDHEVTEKGMTSHA